MNSLRKRLVQYGAECLAGFLLALLVLALFALSAEEAVFVYQGF